MERKWFETHWKNLNALTVAPELANSLLRSSSTTEGLKAVGEKQVWIIDVVLNSLYSFEFVFLDRCV